VLRCFLRLEPDGAALRQWTGSNNGRIHIHKSDEAGYERASTSYNDDGSRESCAGAPREIHGPQLVLEVAWSHGGRRRRQHGGPVTNASGARNVPWRRWRADSVSKGESSWRRVGDGSLSWSCASSRRLWWSRCLIAESSKLPCLGRLAP
jgi:hypothetical protein